jgi:1,2-beta-oligoglucan phosphorylase
MQHLTTPRPDDLGLERINNRTGLVCSLLPNGAVFGLEHVADGHRIMINQTLGSPIAGGMGSLLLRIGAGEPEVLSLAGAAARGRTAAAGDHFVWAGETSQVAHAVTLQLQPEENLWLWRVEVSNRSAEALPCDAVLIQDLGLGEPGFLMNNEAYASQYLDHHIAAHPRLGHVLMARQNLAQAGRHPWVAHGCVEGAVGFATDFRQLLGPAHRDGDQLSIPFGTSLPSLRLQHECACAALQSAAVTLAPGAAASWTFFGIYRTDHPAASGDADLALIDEALSAREALPAEVPSAWRTASLSPPLRSCLLDAASAVADLLSDTALRERYPFRSHLEWLDGRLLSFFTPAEPCSRHVVLRDKERTVLRRHGAILVSGTHMLPDERTLCVTCWMHGVFGAQLTVGNTSFHRLLSVSRDPYNITRGSGLRLLVDLGEGWRLLTVPSVFEMGLTDCCWVYQLRERTISVSAVVSGEEAAVQWKLAVQGEACRFLVCGHLVMGEQEFAHAAPWEIDTARKRCSFRPEPRGLWSQRYPDAVYYLVTSTPQSLDALGSEQLLHGDGARGDGTGGYVVLRTSATNEFIFAVVGSLTDPKLAEQLAARFAGGVADTAVQAGAAQHWRGVTRGIRIESDVGDAGVSAIDTVFPWLVHDAMVHLTVPHGLEQYTGGAWGTRDVCQGPLELLLALEHDAPARAIVEIVFAQQYAQRGDWPQWFMLEPYSAIQAREAHGDVIIWPLKALCDYVEATGDFAILAESIPWRREDTLERGTAADPICAHVDKLIATVCGRFVPGTHLLRYGNGDWNDSLQPVDPAKRDWMVSSWTVGLLYEQLRRYAAILRRAGRADGAAQERLAAAIREDFNRFLIRDGTVAGYGVFSPEGGLPELLFHPADQRTGVTYSLLPMTQAMLGGLFTPAQSDYHVSLIKRHLEFADGVRLMDRPIAYHGGPEVVFQRAESAAFFGREVGLMYTHAHLRHAQAMALLGEANEAWDALLTANPIAVTDRLAQATLRQRNSYFSSSDAAFRDRYQASAEWERVRGANVAVDGGWRIYSSGPGVYINVLVRYVSGVRRDFGIRIVRPRLPPALPGLSISWPAAPSRGSPPQ